MEKIYEYVEYPYEKIKKKLLVLFSIIKVVEIEEELIEFNYEIELEKLLNSINDFNLPNGLVNTLTYRVFASVLKHMLVMNNYSLIEKLDIQDLTRVVSMKEYETDIKFGEDTNLAVKEQNILKYLTYLQEYGEKYLYRYKRISWR